MKAISPETWLWLLSYGILIGSACVWILIARQWRLSGTVLPYEPRRAVPWNFVAALPACLFAVVVVRGALTRSGEPLELGLEDFLANMSQMLVFAILAVILTIAASGANWRDLGLPASEAQFRRDVVLGVLGWLACVPPVIAVQWVMVKLLQEGSQNPVFELIGEHTDWRRLAVAFFSAVVVAPFSEEIFFRLLLQGWLEKISETTTLRMHRGDASVVDVEESAPTPEIPCSIRRLIPLCVGAFVFSLAHFGNGPDLVALFVFALFVGYLYQRTHRIVPCIVVHMLFNALMLLSQWLTIRLPQPPEGIAS